MYLCSTDLCDLHCSQDMEQLYHKDSPTSKHLNLSTLLLWSLSVIYHCLEPQRFHERPRESRIPGTKVCLQRPPGIPVGHLPVVSTIRLLKMDAEGCHVWEESSFQFLCTDLPTYWSLFWNETTSSSCWNANTFPLSHAPRLSAHLVAAFSHLLNLMYRNNEI